MSYQASRPYESEQPSENQFESVREAFARAHQARSGPSRPAPRAFHGSAPREVRYQKPQVARQNSLDEAFSQFFRQP